VAQVRKYLRLPFAVPSTGTFHLLSMAYPMTFVLMACLSVLPLASAGTDSDTLPRDRALTDLAPEGGTGRARTNTGPGRLENTKETLGLAPGQEGYEENFPALNGDESRDLGPGGKLPTPDLGPGGRLPTPDLGPGGRLIDESTVGAGGRAGTLSALQGIIGDLSSHAHVLNQLTDDNKLGKDTETWKNKSQQVWTETMGVHNQAQVLLSKMMAAHIVLSMQAKGMHVERTPIAGGFLRDPSEKVKLLSTMYKIYPMHLRRLHDQYDHPSGKHETVNDAAADIVAENGGFRGDPRHGNLPNN